VIFTGEYNYSRLVFIVGHRDVLHHRAYHIHMIILKRDDTFRACSHTGRTPSAASRLKERRSLLILINSSEGALFSAPLARRAALHEGVGPSHVPRPGMHSNAFCN